jgi:hypothetical protein
MNRWLRSILIALLLTVLHACASVNPTQLVGRIPIPGGVYSWGTFQKVEALTNLEIAQSRVLVYSNYISPWRKVLPANLALAQVSGLQSYFPMQARWRLKDGREFILESVDQGAYVREYMKTHEIRLQWEREGRKFAAGDSQIMLAHDINDDTLRLKWVVTINRTPFHQRLRTDGAANPWKFEEEEHVIAVIRGAPASGIDFNQTYDPRK